MSLNIMQVVVTKTPTQAAALSVFFKFIFTGIFYKFL